MKISQRTHAILFYSFLSVSVIGTLAMAFMPMGKNGSMQMSMGSDQSMHMGK